MIVSCMALDLRLTIAERTLTGAALVAYALLVPTDVTSELEVRKGFGMDMYYIDLENVIPLMKVCFRTVSYARNDKG